MSKNLKVLSRLFLILGLLFLSTNPILPSNGLPGITEHLGAQIPLNLKFTNSHGKSVLLKDIINKPTVIDFVYYKCTGICTPLMAEVSDVVGKINFDPGKEYNLLCVSIDPSETPAVAAEKKHAMFSICTKNLTDSSWIFLTGDSTSIHKLTNIAGFNYIRSNGGFLHKGILIFVDKTGKIVQYLAPGYGKDSGNFELLPAEFELAIKKAAKGELTPTIAKVLQTCFTFIPEGRTVFVLFMVFLSSIVMITAVFFIIKKTKLKK